MTVTPSAPHDELTGDTAARLDQFVTDLAAGAQRWASTPLAGRAALLRATQASIAMHAEEWAEAAIAAKNLTIRKAAGEEWISGPYATMRALEAAAKSLDKLAAGESPLAGVKAKAAPNGGTAFRVYPSGPQEALLLLGLTGEVWTVPGQSEAEARKSAGLGANRVGENGGVGLVLGAGNVTSIGPLDVLYELVAFNRVSILKLNPTFESLLPVMEQALAPLIDFGALRIVLGAAAVGGYLTAHDQIDHVHITGSLATHDAIVWGVGEEAGANRAANTPKLSKPISSELGGVSPIIVVPGRWSKADIRFQAEAVATQRIANGGSNCIAGQMLIVSNDWDQREEFLTAVREVMQEAGDRRGWYPGGDRKIAAADAEYPNAERFGPDVRLVEVTAETSQAACSTEYFGPVLAHTALPGLGRDFLDHAVEFANDSLDGTLGATVIIDPRTEKAMGAAFGDAIARLRYGIIGINFWTAWAFMVPNFAWGAFPGQTLDDVGSGIGVVHNSHLIDGAERSILRSWFRPRPRVIKKVLFVTAKHADTTARRLTAWAGNPTWQKLPGIGLAALRG